MDGRRKRAAAAKRAVDKRAAAAKRAAAKRAPARKVGGARKAKAKPQRSRDGLPARAAAAAAAPVRKDSPTLDPRAYQTFSDQDEDEGPCPREARLQAVFAALPRGEQDALLAHVDGVVASVYPS